MPDEIWLGLFLIGYVGRWMLSLEMEEEMFRRLVGVTCRQEDQAGEDPEERNTLNDNVGHFVGIYSLDPHAGFRDGCYWRGREERVQKKEGANESNQ